MESMSQSLACLLIHFKQLQVRTPRNSRMGFTQGTTIPDTAGSIKQTVANAGHPIFGLELCVGLGS